MRALPIKQRGANRKILKSICNDQRGCIRVFVQIARSISLLSIAPRFGRIDLEIFILIYSNTLRAKDRG